jgi:hypothetical protein
MFPLWTLTDYFPCFQCNGTKSRTICCNFMKTLSITDVNELNHKMQYQCTSSTIMELKVITVGLISSPLGFHHLNLSSRYIHNFSPFLLFNFLSLSRYFCYSFTFFVTISFLWVIRLSVPRFCCIIYCLQSLHPGSCVFVYTSEF